MKYTRLVVLKFTRHGDLSSRPVWRYRRRSLLMLKRSR